MLSKIARRLRLFIRSELDLHKDRLLEVVAEAERKSFEGRLVAQANQVGISFDREKNSHILQGFKYLDNLCLNVKAQITLTKTGSTEVHIGDACFVPETLQEVRILSEIFEDEVYLVESKEPMYVWDVGANVATASLYFATVLGWDVSAYELFPKTAEAAERNISRSGLENRIHLSAFGLGRKTETLTLQYNEQSRGSNGMFGNTDPWVTGQAIPIDVKVVDVAEEFKVVQDRAKGRPILAKFDCEGAEYDIIPRLIETGQIRSIEAIVMEEHLIEGHSREELVNAIRDAGFIVRRSRNLFTHVALLFAVRSGS